MVTTMALSESLSKFVDKVNENVSKLKERDYIHSPHEDESDGRPASPFFLLLSEGEEEFRLNDNDAPTSPPPRILSTALTQTVPEKPSVCPQTIEEPAIDTPTKAPLLHKPSPIRNPTVTNTSRTDSDSVSFSTCNGGQTISLHYATKSTHESPPVTAVDTLDTKPPSPVLRREEAGTTSKPPPQLLTRQEFDRLFDHSGRLVNEHELRRNIFKNGIHNDVRKQVWQFLFELYPFNTTEREREILKVEQTVQYEAMKIRWKKLLKTLVNDYEGVAYCPKWFTGCTKQKSAPYPTQMDSSDEDEVGNIEKDVDDHLCSAKQSVEIIEQEIEPLNSSDGITDVSEADIAGERINELDSFGDEDIGDSVFLTEDPCVLGSQPDHSTPDEQASPESGSPPSLPVFCTFSHEPKHCDGYVPSQSQHSPMEQTCRGGTQDGISDVDMLRGKSSTCDRTFMTEDGNTCLSRRLSSGGNVSREDDTEIPLSNAENSAENSSNDQHEDTCDCEQVNDSLALSDERLEKLPPWIAQMLNASTLPSHKCKTKSRIKNKANSKDTKYPCDDFIRAMDEDITKRKELLGIVENANKYLKQMENIVNKSRNETSVPTHVQPLEVELEKEELDAPARDPDPLIQGTHSSFYGYDQKDFEVVIRADDVKGVDCPYCDESEEEVAKITLNSSIVGEDQLKFMQVQAQIYAARQTYDPNKISESVRVIDKDVPRTDRELEAFSGNDNIHLVELRDALLTYAFFNPDVGYAQGMNDIMARFLVVMKKESEAYWMFVRYMDHFKHHFMEEGMLEKIGLVEQLLLKMDKDLHDYLHTTDMGLMFCHRWLLLNFKREFEYHESLRVFEITSSRHLEVSSLQAELERSKQRAEEFVQGSAGSHLEEVYISPEIPFDIFICVAMLMECRDVLMATSDVSRIYEILSNLPHTLDLENILEKSEQLFYQYCRRTVVDCFQVIDDVV